MRSVNIKITIQTGSPDHREIDQRIICQSEDYSVDALYAVQILQGYQLNMAVFLWDLVKSDLSSVGQCTLEKSLFTKYQKPVTLCHLSVLLYMTLWYNSLNPAIAPLYILTSLTNGLQSTNRIVYTYTIYNMYVYEPDIINLYINMYLEGKYIQYKLEYDD